MMLKKTIAAAVSGVMLFVTGGISVMDVSNTVIMAEAAASDHTAEDALNWVRAHENTTLEFYDDINYAQCVDLTMAYYDYLGVEFSRGNAADYSWRDDAVPPGWTRTKGGTPQNGDILVYIGGNGHVAIYDESGYTWHQNYNYHSEVEKLSFSEYNWRNSGYWGCIHPNFTTNQKPLGFLDAVKGGDGQLYVKGWAFDPDEPTKQLMVHIYVGGGLGSNASSHAVLANTKRQDVDDVHHCGAYHGFEATIYPPESGDLEIYAYAIDAEGGVNPELSGCPKKAKIKADTEKPVISNVEITDISSTGYTITCDVSDNISIKKVEFPTWTKDKDQDDLIWHKGTVKDGKATFRLDTKDHQKQTGLYITHIYAYDNAGNSVCKTLEAVKVPNPVSNIRVTHIDKTGYEVSCDVDPAWGAVKIQFPTWTDKDAQDDLIWHNSTILDGKSTYRVKASDHNSETGIYITHIWVYDEAGNACSIAVPGVNVRNLGDVNANGTFNVVDLVLVQKWLLQVPLTELTDPDAADMNADSEVDIFDLALLKRALLTS